MTALEDTQITVASDSVEQICSGMLVIEHLLDKIEDLSWPRGKAEESLQELLEMLQCTFAPISSMCGEGTPDSRRLLRKIHALLEPPRGADGSTMPPETAASMWDRFSRGRTECVILAKKLAAYGETEEGKHQQRACPAGDSHTEGDVPYSILLCVCANALAARTRLLERTKFQ